MRILLFYLFVMFIPEYSLSQSSTYLESKNYKGYNFPKEVSLWGLPPSNDRYTLNIYEIAMAEKILNDSIDSILSKQSHYKRPSINPRTLSKYLRQYVGYTNDKKEVIVWINLYKHNRIGDQDPSEDLISVFDGGFNFWSIKINISNKKLYEMHVNGDG